MTNAKGTSFLLKTSDGAGPQRYTTVAGLRTTQLAITGELAEAPRSPDGWRNLIEGGARSVSITASGIFLGSAAEASIRANALAGMVEPYELSFENGEKLRGKFLVKRLDYVGDFGGERNYTVALESSGPVVAS